MAAADQGGRETSRRGGNATPAAPNSPASVRAQDVRGRCGSPAAGVRAIIEGRSDTPPTRHQRPKDFFDVTMTSTMRRLACALTLCAAGAFGGAAAAQGFTGILGGGPIYAQSPPNIKELVNSGFNELIVWSVEVNSAGDLNLNGGFPLVADGKYVGKSSYPHFAKDLAKIKAGAPMRITFSIGSSNYGDWEDIKALVNAQGTGPKSILYKNFAALMKALPVDAIDYDDENGYDAASTLAFSTMLGQLGYHVTMDPYTNAGYWTGVVAQINKATPGLVDAIHLQTYAGGEGNSPCGAQWNFGGVPVLPGISDQTSAPPYLTPAQTKTRMETWHKLCGITGGWVWIFDQIVGTPLVKQYAKAINKGVGA
jgi:hypothetical protein